MSTLQNQLYQPTSRSPTNSILRGMLHPMGTIKEPKRRIILTKTPNFDQKDFAAEAILRQVARNDYKSIIGKVTLPSVSSATKASSQRGK